MKTDGSGARFPGWKTLSGIRSLRRVSLAVSFCLSFLLILACNLWTYETERIRLEEGDWHVRIVQPVSQEQKQQMLASAWISSLQETETEDGKPVTELIFARPQKLYEQLPELEQLTGLDPDAVQVHDLLLSRMLITDPQDPSPPLLLPAMLALLVLCLLALILVLKSAYTQILATHIRTLASLSTLGATPKDLRSMVMSLCLRSAFWPVLAGCVCGSLACFLLVQTTNLFFKNIAGRHAASFDLPWSAIAASLFLSYLTIWLAALQPARRLSRVRPLRLLRENGLEITRSRKFSLLSTLGLHGQLASSFLSARKKSMRLSRLSLFLSCLAFSLLSAFTALAFLSTQLTYFERYQDVWDIRVDLPGVPMEDFRQTAELQKLEGVSSASVYELIQAQTQLDPAWQSAPLQKLGGLSALDPDAEQENGLKAGVSVLILDDASFEVWTRKNSLPKQEGAVLINRIWDSTVSSFRDPLYIPFLNPDLFDSGSSLAVTLQNKHAGDGQAVLPVSAALSEPPRLREEYGKSDLLLVSPLSLWTSAAADLPVPDPETRINVVADVRDSQAELDRLEQEVLAAAARPEARSENRLQEKADNEQMKAGSQSIWTLVCTLMALGSLSGLISGISASVRAQKQAFAQLQSLGMTRQDLNRIFFLEALNTAGWPILSSLMLSVLAVWGAALLSHMAPAVFLRAVPWGMIVSFCLLLFFCILFSYWFQGRKLQNASLSEILKNDSSF